MIVIVIVIALINKVTVLYVELGVVVIWGLGAISQPLPREMTPCRIWRWGRHFPEMTPCRIWRWGAISHPSPEFWVRSVLHPTQGIIPQVGIWG